MNKNLVTAAVCGVVLVSGCSSDDDEAEATTGPAVISMPVSQSALLVAGPVSDPADEQLRGKPVSVNGCLGAVSGEITYLVVWPDGTTVAGPDSDALQIGDDVLEPGQSFVGTGTFVTGKPFPAQFPELPLKCLGANTEKIMWLQEIDEISE